MTQEQIEKAILKNSGMDQVFQIRFKTRNSIIGLFIKTSDYLELSRKNFWRIVSEKHIGEYRKSRDLSLTRIFNGVEFIKLEATAGTAPLT